MLDRYRAVRHRFHAFRREAHLLWLTGLAVSFSALTGVAARVRIPLPFAPVPITLQTVAVLLAGRRPGGPGGLRKPPYVAMGLGVVPWFTGGDAGLGHLLGPTGATSSGSSQRRPSSATSPTDSRVPDSCRRCSRSCSS